MESWIMHTMTKFRNCSNLEMQQIINKICLLKFLKLLSVILNFGDKVLAAKLSLNFVVFPRTMCKI